MTLKTRFIALTLAVAMLTVLFASLFIQAYHSRIPILNKLFYHAALSSDPENPTNPYEGLSPEPNNPTGVYYENHVIVLMYHDVSPTPVDVRSLSVAKLEQQLTLMRDNNFHWITMDQYRDFILHGASVPANAVLLTFDDGYESFYKYAYPLLTQFEAPASNFLIVSTVGNPKHVGVPKLNWDQVIEMHHNGMTFFSHTYDEHQYVSADTKGKEQVAMLAKRMYLKKLSRRETESEYETRVRNDLKKANALLEQKLGEPNHILAFPYGAFSQPLLDICKELGIDITFSVKSGMNKSGQDNGFRVNAGGTSNDPALQMSLMKHADDRLAHSHYDQAPAKKHYALKVLVVLFIVGCLWLWTGRKLLRKRRADRRMNLHSAAQK